MEFGSAPSRVRLAGDCTRRELLRAAAVVATMPSLLAAAQPSGPGRRFLFVFNHGGWDTTRVLAPMFGTEVAMEPDAEPFTAGSLSLVDHPSRPSARRFFERYHHLAVVLQGMLVPSVAHEVCARLVMTGRTRGLLDWAATLGAAQADRYVLPNLVMEAPTYPEQHAISVARTGASGQLDELLTGAVFARSRPSVEELPLDVRAVVDRHVLRHAAARAASAAGSEDGPMLAAFDDAARRAVALERERYRTRFVGGGDLTLQLGVAIDAIEAGIARVVSIGFPSLLFPWDSHFENDAIQAVLWEQLFAGPVAATERLASTPGTAPGATLLDETVVVVLSEMGRSPTLNAARGKDHWPYTSALLFGGGLTGDRVIGGHDERFAGRGVDRQSGELSEGAPLLDAGALGASLLALGGLDPGALLPESAPLGPLVG